MGGVGSGRRPGFGMNRKTGDLRSLDVRWLKREGALKTGRTLQVTWKRQKLTRGSILVTAEVDRLILSYRCRNLEREWHQRCYPVLLDTTPCHIGGERTWFLCPALRCGKRVAILYGDTFFACRQCQSLTYESQHVIAPDRAALRANRIRERLDWPGGILEGSDWDKPKGMHWRTYERLSAKHDNFANIALARYR